MVMANPILIREVRGRWRRPISYIILFFYGVILASLMGFVYASNVNGVNLSDDGAGNLLGRRLFSGFLGLQTGVWMLLAAALTAPSIAGERERGLLQGILLSPVTPGAIVRGKLASGLGFIGLLLLVPMPITSLCFTLGGLAPWEFLISFLLLGSTALSGACLGLAASACNKRSDTALITSFAITLTLSWPPVLVALTFNQGFFAAGALMCLIYQAILTAAALGVASDALNNILPEREGEMNYQLNSFDQFGFGTPDKTINSIVLGREDDLSYDRAALYEYQTPPLIHNGAQAEKTTFAAKSNAVKPAKTWKDTPLSALINFQNPVMQREVRARLRRRAPEDSGNTYEYQGVDYVVFIVFLTLTLGLIAYLSGSGPTLGVLWLLGALVISSVNGALTFVREREQQTLQPLLLTMLSPGEVLLGKMGAACFMGALYSAPFLPLVLLSATSNLLLVPLILLLGTGAIWLGAAIGLSLSWLCRQAGVAVAGAFAAAVTTFAASWNLTAYWFTHGVALPLTINLTPAPVSPVNQSMVTPPASPEIFYYTLPIASFWIVGGALLLLILRVQLSPKAMEKDGTSIWNRDLTKEYT